MAALLISNMQTNHATLAEHINPFNPNLPALGIDPSAFTTQAGAQTAAQIDGCHPSFSTDVHGVQTGLADAPAVTSAE